MTENALLQHLDQLAPWKVRVLACDRSTPLTAKQIARKSGLSESTIKTLTWSDSWYHFEMSTITKFSNACGVDLLNQAPYHKRLKRMMKTTRGPAHLSTPQRKFWNSVFVGEKNWRGKTV